MDYTLVIDQGNTSSKATVFCDDKYVDTIRYTMLSVEELCPLFEKYDIRGVIYCTVVKVDVRLVESLRYMTNAPVVVMTHETPLPITIDYKTPKTLGLDRVAACTAASSYYPEETLLVVDAGTALTIDLIDSKSRFKGGNISPGLYLRLKSLHEFTGALPMVEVEEGDQTLDFGQDTETAIRSGVVNGLIAEIKEAYNRASKFYGCSKIVITGGDADYLISKIGMSEKIINHHPYLVAEGLNRILRYNENN